MSAGQQDERLSPLVGTPGDELALERAKRWTFIRAHADPWYRQHLTRLFRWWEECNDGYFDKELWPPHPALSAPESSKAYGEYRAISSEGLESEVRIRPSLLTGDHPHVLAGEEFAEGRARVADDVLLYLMVRQWQHEVADEPETAYHGHGPTFRDKCNAIGSVLGLGPVRTSKRRGPDGHLPSCADWPHCVRPLDYYLGAYRVPTGGDIPPASAEPRPRKAPAGLSLDEAAAFIVQYGASRLGEVLDAAERRLDDRGRAELVQGAGGWVLARVRHQEPPAPVASPLPIAAERRSMSPHALNPVGSPERCWQAVRTLKSQYEFYAGSWAHLRDTVSEVIAERDWEFIPVEQPYGSFDALLQAELGISGEEFFALLPNDDPADELPAEPAGQGIPAPAPDAGAPAGHEQGEVAALRREVLVQAERAGWPWLRYGLPELAAGPGAESWGALVADAALRAELRVLLGPPFDEFQTPERCFHDVGKKAPFLCRAKPGPWRATEGTQIACECDRKQSPHTQYLDLAGLVDAAALLRVAEARGWPRVVYKRPERTIETGEGTWRAVLAEANEAVLRRLRLGLGRRDESFAETILGEDMEVWHRRQAERQAKRHAEWNRIAALEAVE